MAQDKKAIEARLKQFQSIKRGHTDKAIRSLPDTLADDETIDAALGASMGGAVGLLIATDRRVIFAGGGFTHGKKVLTFPYGDIMSLQHHPGMVLGAFQIVTPAGSTKIEGVGKSEGRVFADLVQGRIGAGPQAAAPQPNPAASTDVPDQLRQLAALRDDGIITAEDFEAKKRQLLGL